MEKKEFREAVLKEPLVFRPGEVDELTQDVLSKVRSVRLLKGTGLTLISSSFSQKTPLPGRRS